jgi:hypothetical protein
MYFWGVGIGELLLNFDMTVLKQDHSTMPDAIGRTRIGGHGAEPNEHGDASDAFELPCGSGFISRFLLV